MSRITLIFSLVFLSVYIFAQSLELDKNGFTKDLSPGQVKASGLELLGRFHWVKYSNSNRRVALARKGNKWGVVDTALTAIIPFKFGHLEFINDYVLRSYNNPTRYYRLGPEKVDTLKLDIIKPFSNGYARAAHEKKYCIIDSTGTLVFYFEDAFLAGDQKTQVNTFSSAESEREMREKQQLLTLETISDPNPVGPDLFILLKNQQYCLFNRSGQQLSFPGITSFSPGENKDYIKCFDKDYKQGLINLQGKLVLPVQYDYISDDDGAIKKTRRKFLRVKKGNLYGLTDKNGKFMIPCVMENVSFTSSKHYFAVKKTGQNFIYDTSWKPIKLPPNLKNVTNVWERKQGLAYFSWSKEKCLIYNEKAIRKTDSLTSAYLITDSLFLVNHNQKGYYILNTALNSLHDVPSSHISYPYESEVTSLIFTTPGKMFLKTMQGRTIQTYTYSNMSHTSRENEYVIKQNKMAGLVDSLNTVLIPLIYQTIQRKRSLIVAYYPGGNAIYDLSYKKIGGLDSIDFVMQLPGNISFCKGKEGSVNGLVLDDKLIFQSRQKINSYGDGLFYLYDPNQTYILDFYGNKVAVR